MQTLIVFLKQNLFKILLNYLKKNYKFFVLLLFLASTQTQGKHNSEKTQYRRFLLLLYRAIQVFPLFYLVRNSFIFHSIRGCMLLILLWYRKLFLYKKQIALSKPLKIIYQFLINFLHVDLISFKTVHYFQNFYYFREKTTKNTVTI